MNCRQSTEGRLPAFFLAIFLLSSPAPAQGVDANGGRSIAASCANCHGTNGISQGGTASLAGKSKEEIVGAMQEFKTGARTGTIMPQLAKGYTDAQVEQAAGWFASQKAAP